MNRGSGEFPGLRWIAPPGRPRSIALLAGGLNLAPAALDPLRELLCRHHHLVADYTLPGHRGDRSELINLSGTEVLPEATALLHLLASVAREQGLPPVRIVAASLGALILLTASLPSEADVASDERHRRNPGPPPVAEALLLAPALALRPRSRLLHLPARLLPPGVGVPSLSPASLRVYRSLPLGAYRLLYTLYRDWRLRSSRFAVRFPVRVYIDPADEFVSRRGTEVLTTSGVLPQATVVSSPTPGPHHLLVSPKSMGEVLWRDLSLRIARQ